MGIAGIFTAAMRHVSWGKVATVAMQYGPDLIKKLKGQVHSRLEAADEVTLDELYEKIDELHATVLNQQKIIEADNNRISLLEQRCSGLQTRLKIYMSVAAVSVAASVIFCLLLFTRP